MVKIVKYFLNSMKQNLTNTIDDVEGQPSPYTQVLHFSVKRTSLPYVAGKRKTTVQ